MNIQRLDSPHHFSANCYLLSDGGEYAVIDPTAPYDDSLIDGTLKYVLLTHGHFDHILDIDSWVANGAVVLIHKDERAALSDPIRNCFKIFYNKDDGYFGDAEVISDGDIILLGKSEIKVISCPGHTIGSVTYLYEDHAFVGDTIFAGGICGRTDVPTGNGFLLQESVIRLASLPESVIVYPGHGKPTTIKQFKQDIGL